MGMKAENDELNRRIKIYEEQEAFHRELMEKHGDDCNKLHQMFDKDRSELNRAQASILEFVAKLAKSEEHCALIKRESDVCYARIAELEKEQVELMVQNSNLSRAELGHAQTIGDLASAIREQSKRLYVLPP